MIRVINYLTKTSFYRESEYFYVSFSFHLVKLNFWFFSSICTGMSVILVVPDKNDFNARHSTYRFFFLYYHFDYRNFTTVKTLIIFNSPDAPSDHGYGYGSVKWKQTTTGVFQPWLFGANTFYIYTIRTFVFPVFPGFL